MPNYQGQGNRVATSDEILQMMLVVLKTKMKAVAMIKSVEESKFAKQFDKVNFDLPIKTRVSKGNQFKAQPLVTKSIPFSIDYQFNFGSRISTRDWTLSRLPKLVDSFFGEGISQLANAADQAVLMEMKKKFFTSYGTPGTAPSFSSLQYANAVQSDLGVPMDGKMRGIFPSWDRAGFSTEAFAKNNPAMVDRAVKEGFDGNIAGYDWVESSNIPTHTVGAHGGTPLVNGANQNGEYLITDGWTAGVTGLLKAGDIIKFTTIKEINPTSREIVPSGRVARFIVQEDVNSDGSGNATIKIWPPLNDGKNVTSTDQDGVLIDEGMYQNISGAIPNNEPLVVEGTASTTYRLDFLFHSAAVWFACVKLDIPQEFNVRSTVHDPDTGLAISMCGWADGENLAAMRRYDLVFGLKAGQAELGMRHWSAAI
jgi:hypothetical protein